MRESVGASSITCGSMRSVILAVFAKKTRRTPVQQIEASRDRLRRYLRDLGER